MSDEPDLIVEVTVRVGERVVRRFPLEGALHLLATAMEEQGGNVSNAKGLIRKAIWRELRRARGQQPA